MRSEKDTTLVPTLTLSSLAFGDQLRPEGRPNYIAYLEYTASVDQRHINPSAFVRWRVTLGWLLSDAVFR